MYASEIAKYMAYVPDNEQFMVISTKDYEKLLQISVAYRQTIKQMKKVLDKCTNV